MILNTIALVAQTSAMATSSTSIDQAKISSVQDIYKTTVQDDVTETTVEGIAGIIGTVSKVPVVGALIGGSAVIGGIVAETSHGPIYTDPVKIWQNSYVNPHYQSSTRENCNGYNGC